MKLSLVISITLFFSICGKAQDHKFLDQWFLGFPVYYKNSSLYEHGLTSSHFKVVGSANDSFALFFLDTLNWLKVVPKENETISSKIDSTLIEISISYRSTTGFDKPRRHYSGPLKVVTVEYFLKSNDSIYAWVDRIIRKALDFQHISSESVDPQPDTDKYEDGEILFLDTRKKYRFLEVYQNIYATGKTSLLVSYEFEFPYRLLSSSTKTKL